MTKKTRLIILAVCAALFLIFTPYIILYSLGYRVDFKNLKIVGTGGIYVKALPQPVTITIDANPSQTTGILSQYIFSQNLLPGDHVVSIKKDGYFNYQKTLPVSENQVTKLEHVTLFKKDIEFTTLENIFLAPSQNNLQWSSDGTSLLVHAGKAYYLAEPFLLTPKTTPLLYLAQAEHIQFNQQNSKELFFIKQKNLYSNLQELPLIKNVVAYSIENNTATWLSYDGIVYQSNISGTDAKPLSSKTLTIPNNSYKIMTASGMVFLQQNDSLLLLNNESKSFENFYSPVSDVKVSPDGQKLLYYNDHEIVYSLLAEVKNHLFLNRFSEKISDLYWLGNDYLIFNLGGNVMVSEIDVRGNINTINIARTPGMNSRIFFNQQDLSAQAGKKLYIVDGKNLMISEKLIP